MLTAAQKQTFFEKGYLILPQVIAEAASGFEAFVWDCLGQLYVFGLRVFTFLSEVKPRSGGTLVVTGSHQLVAGFRNRLTEEERGQKYAHLRKRFNRPNAWMRRLTREDEHAVGRNEALMEEERVVEDVPVRVEEFCGRPGDIVLMHPWLLHTRAPNAGTGPRFMLAKSIYTHAAQMNETVAMATS